MNTVHIKTSLLGLLCVISLQGCPAAQGQSPEMQTQHQDHRDMDMSQLKLSDIQSQTKSLDMTQLNQAPKTQGSATPQAQFPVDSKRTLYRCPMHPQIIQDKPGTCPICGMDLEPVQSTTSSSATSLQDRAAVQINPTRQQLIGVKTTTIQEKKAQSSIYTVAKIAENEEQRSHIHTKYSGWIEEVYANFKGQYVKRGQALLKIYSPELVTAQEEYLLALKAAQQFQYSEFESSRETSTSLLNAAYEKLRLYDLSPGQIAHLKNTGQVQRTLTVFASSSGYIAEFQALKGMRVTAGMPLYTLDNLSNVWVQTQVYENDLALIKVGQKARITLPFMPESVYWGKVSYIDPTLNPKTRTANVRLVLENPGHQLKPEMFANVEIQIQHQLKKLLIPASAVIDTGRKQLAFLAKENGLFEPVELKLGQRLGSDYELKQGPVAGSKVVSEAQFLIDSESQLQAVVSQMGGGGHVH